MKSNFLNQKINQFIELTNKTMQEKCDLLINICTEPKSACCLFNSIKTEYQFELQCNDR